MFQKNLLIQFMLLALLILGFVSSQVWGEIIPAERRTTWNPGLNAVGGIPNRTTIYKTLTPSGGDDTKAIQDALNACPANQVVMLGKGTFKVSGQNGALFMNRSNITLRGSGPNNTLVLNSGPGAVIVMGTLWVKYKQTVNITSNAVKDKNTATVASNPGYKVGELLMIDQLTNNNLTWWSERSPVGDASRGWFCRMDRPIGQVMEVASISGNTVTFNTPFHLDFQTAYTAQISRFDQTDPLGVRYSGVEDMHVRKGQGGDGGGGIHMFACAYSWVKNVENDSTGGTCMNIDGCFRCEIRDSYFHSSSNPNPGGGGYGIGFNGHASDNLLENSISWNFNKVMVMRASGGGNVIGYNYMQDGYGAGYPNQIEDGLNASHMTTPYMELFEGNESFNFDADAVWGNSIYITVFRNRLTGQRIAHPPLNTYSFTDGSGTYYFEDEYNRRAIGLSQKHWWYSFIGNVLGYSGMTLLSNPKSRYKVPQTGWSYEDYSKEGIVPMWKLGYGGSVQPDPTVISRTLRHGNFDYVTNTQKWDSTNTDHNLPNSLYLTQKPAFMNGYTWPWVDPQGTTKTYRLPAKDRFDGVPPPSIKPNYTNGITMPLSLAVVPNFLNRTIMVQYEVKNPGKIEASIYNVSGEKIKNLISEGQNAGIYSIVWDGKIRNNQNVSQGMYYILVEQNGNQACKVFPLLK